MNWLLYSCLLLTNSLMGFDFTHSNSENQLPQNYALQRVTEINILLADPQITEKEKLKYSKELFCLLTGSGKAYLTYGQLSPSISAIELDNFPTTDKAAIFPYNTAWEKTEAGFFPTHDWFQQMATFPKSPFAFAHTGYYKVTYNQGGSLNYNILIKKYLFDLFPISESYDNGFTLDTTKTLNPHPFVKWQAHKVGNMVRHIVYKKITYYIAQGSAFQAASYRTEFPLVGLQKPDLLAKFSQTILRDGTKKYRLKTQDCTYLFYGNPTLNLSYLPLTGKLISKEPYTGMINAISFSNDLDLSFEQLADSHASAVVIRGQGSLLLDGNYEFAYMCQDLDNSPTAKDPLIFINRKHNKNYLDNGLAKALQTINSSPNENIPLSSSAIYFKATSIEESVFKIPFLDDLRDMTTYYANKMIKKGTLSNKINKALSIPHKTTMSEMGEELYQIAITLGYAVKVLEIANTTPEAIQELLTPLYLKLTSLFTNAWPLFENNSAWGIIVTKMDENGNQKFLANHILDYGRFLYSLALLGKFEKEFVPFHEQFLPKKVSKEGYESFTNQDMGDIIAADIGETGGLKRPLFRNFDIYSGNSRLSGIENPTEKREKLGNQSVVVFANLALTAWLELTQPNSIQASCTRTRWYLEASK